MSHPGPTLAGMKPTEFWHWMLADQFGRRRRSSCRYTEVEALARDPGATRVEGSCEVRLCPESPEELTRLAPDTGGFMRESRARAAKEGR